MRFFFILAFLFLMFLNLDAVISPDKDFYKILGVEKKASESEIKTKYRALARKYHPDKAKGGEKARERAEKKFMEIGEAYEVLSDKKQRKEYDMARSMGTGFHPNVHGHPGNHPGADNMHFQTFQSGSGGEQHVNMQQFEEIMRQMGGGSGRGSQNVRHFSSASGGGPQAAGGGSGGFEDLLFNTMGGNQRAQFEQPNQKRSRPARPNFEQPAFSTNQFKKTSPGSKQEPKQPARKPAKPNTKSSSQKSSGEKCHLDCSGVQCQRKC
eukprot:c10167_g1_i2.p1 GENE.c10167_g1_i2~~c10167_g1_i2.p1  ORF type:complete len:267 (-),score=34.17 c10167_g1_i2:119-919(-)